MPQTTGTFTEKILLPPAVTRMPGKATDTGFTDVLRLDGVHPVISGNKWFKLKYALQAAQEGGYTRITTFGGAYSNHIVATACACKAAGLASRGIIRGEVGPVASPVLELAAGYGMELEFMNRSHFRTLRETGFVLPGCTDYIIPEGGAAETGVRGAKEILSYADLARYTHVFCAIGTGTTAAGLLQAMLPQQQLVAINVLKGGSFQQQDILRLSGSTGEQLFIRNNFHFGGYAKYTPELLGFMNQLYAATGIPTDIIYTAKLFYALEQITQNELAGTGARILVIHSGGLTGNCSLPKGTLIF